MSDHPPLPLSFRSELLQHLMPALDAGECCSLIGISSAGKSNLVRFLQRPDVQQQYWSDQTTWVVLVDTHGLVFGAQPAEYVVAELMIHRLIRECERHNLSPDTLAELDTLHARLIAQPDALLAMRYLERVVGRLHERHGLRLVIVFDQFEDIWRSLDARFFLNLRYLRDQFKYHLAYLLITREQLQRIRARTRDDLADTEAFWELFSSHVYGLGMYSEADASTMVDRIAARVNIETASDTKRAALAASGRHPGLLRAVFWALQHNGALADDQAALAQTSAVAAECHKIWNDLLPDEQRLVQVVASETPLNNPNDPALADVYLKEVIQTEPLRLFSPVFTRYVRSHTGAGMPGILVDIRLRQVWRDGQLLAETLSRLEFSLLEYLARHADTVCPRDDILRHLYQEDMYTANDERLDTLLRRLREALHEDARNPRYLFTHRGVGVRLAQGRVQE